MTLLRSMVAALACVALVAALVPLCPCPGLQSASARHECCGSEAGWRAADGGCCPVVPAVAGSLGAPAATTSAPAAASSVVAAAFLDVGLAVPVTPAPEPLRASLRTVLRV